MSEPREIPVSPKTIIGTVGPARATKWEDGYCDPCGIQWMHSPSADGEAAQCWCGRDLTPGRKAKA